MDVAELNRILKGKLLRRMPKTGDCPLGFGGAGVYRRDESDVAENCFYRPLVTVTVQGAKWSTVGGEKFRLRENEFLAAAVDMPAQNYVVGASREKPFLSISLDLDRNVISGLLSEYPELAPSGGECKGAGTSKIDGGLLGAFLRLYELSENPREAKFMAPILIREIHLRLLMGPLGGQIRAINTPDTSGHRISKAISWLRANYKEPVEIGGLSKLAGMSPASFHRHFKKVTEMSPLQYRKRLRLYEARRLMLAENETAAGATYAVGYESPAQFSRDYRSVFGNPPKRSLRP